MVFSLGHAVRVTSAAMILAAFAGALASMGLVLLMAGRVEQTAGLILGGTMIGYICSAATDILVTFADDTDIVNLHNWSPGQLFRHFLGEYGSHVPGGASRLGSRIPSL